MPEQNHRLTRDDLVAVYHAAAKPRETWRTGCEFERFALRPDGQAVGYGEPHGIRSILETLVARGGWIPMMEGGQPIALGRGNASTTLEPGGQVELSGAPHRGLGALLAEADAYQAELNQATEGTPIRWAACGYTPFARNTEIPWVPKGRYRVMRDYLPRRGSLAHHMMKSTCAVQMSVDFGDEADCARKVELATRMAPLTLALTANSPLKEGQDTGWASYRGHIWRHTDPDRTGVPAPLRGSYTHEAMVDWLLDVPMMFHRVDGHYHPVGGTTFRQFMVHGIEGRFPTLADWSLHQTCVFPEVRVKGLIEVRSADAVDRPLAVALCACVTGLLYGESALDQATRLCDDMTRGSTHAERIEGAARLGLESQVAGRSLAAWARDLCDIARKGLASWSPDDLPLLEPLAQRAESGRSPADDLLDTWRRDPSPASVLEACRY